MGYACPYLPRHPPARFSACSWCLLGHPVRLEPEHLDLGGGVTHLLKWLTLLRADGLGVLVICLLTLHPLAMGLLAGVLAWAAPGHGFRRHR